VSPESFWALLDEHVVFDTRNVPDDDVLDIYELIQDLDQPGHLFVVSRWASREAADAAMSYVSHPNAKRAEQLVSEPRRRTVGAPL
jgi:hypothetical protein